MWGLLGTRNWVQDVLCVCVCYFTYFSFLEKTKNRRSSKIVRAVVKKINLHAILVFRCYYVLALSLIVND